MNPRLRSPFFSLSRPLRGKVLITLTVLTAAALFYIAVSRKNHRADLAGSYSLPWKESTPAEIFGTSP